MSPNTIRGGFTRPSKDALPVSVPIPAKNYAKIIADLKAQSKKAKRLDIEWQDILVDYRARRETYDDFMDNYPSTKTMSKFKKYDAERVKRTFWGNSAGIAKKIASIQARDRGLRTAVRTKKGKIVEVFCSA